MTGRAARALHAPARGSVDDWITVRPDGVIVARSGKVELGTGVRTALTQIVAEELDVDVSRVELVAGMSGVTPDEGYTAGSLSVAIGGESLRRAAAEARAALVELARARTGAPADAAAAVENGVVLVAGHRLSYQDLVGGRPFDRAVTGLVPVKNPADYTVVGRSVPRLDIPAKVTGGGAFVSDVRLPGMLHARVVRPAWFGRPVLDVDVSALPEGARLVRRGDFLAVVAGSEAVAVRAAEQVRVRWGPGESAPSQEELYAWMVERETVDQQLVDGPTPRDPELSATYYWPFQAHGSIGPSAAVADVTDDRTTVYAAAQGVYQLRSGLAALLGLPVESIEVLHRDGSGCYGHNGADDVAADAAVVSQLVGAPVRVQWSRRDEFVWARKGPATVARLSGSLDAGGRVDGWSAEFWTSTHGGRAQVPERFVAGQLLAGVSGPDDVVFVGGDRNAPIDYQVPRRSVTMRWLPRPAIPGSSLRALGSTANTFANESFMDELAHRAGADPLQFRLDHLTDPRGREVLRRVADVAGWGDPVPAGHGRGLAYARYENVGAWLAAVAEVSVDRSSGALRVRRFVVAHDCGLVVNPDGLRAQVEGNVIQSLSRALLEEVRWADGELLSVDWESYPILRFPDVPPVEVVVVDRPDQPSVGAGEPATILTAPAIANAVHAATGARLRKVPFTPRRVREALAAVGARR